MLTRLALVCFLSSCTGDVVMNPPTYYINLDLPPEQRWNEVINDYQNGKHGAKVNFSSFIGNVVDHYVPKTLRPITERLAAGIDNIIPKEYAREIRGIAHTGHIPLGWAVVGSILYDVTAFCTSIVAQNDKDEIVHGRNLDYDFGSMLRNITYNAHFQRNGTTVYSAVMYAGIVGVFTGQKPGVFTVSIDERDKGFWWENALEALESLLLRRANLISLLARQTLESATTFRAATQHLAHTVTWAPAYYIVGGVRPGEGVVITKDRTRPLDLFYLEPYNTRWFLLETNYDRWATPPPTDDRRDPGMTHMKKLGRVNFNTSSLFEVLSTPPVLAPHTTYTTVMSAAKPELFHTWIRNM